MGKWYEEKGKALPMNDAHALMRYEFIEVLIRLSAAKYGRGQVRSTYAQSAGTRVRGRVPALVYDMTISPSLS